MYLTPQALRASSPKRGAAPAPQGAAPLRGSPQCAHWGKGSPDLNPVQEGKDRTHPDHSFPYWHSHNPGDPSVSLTLDSVSLRLGHGAALTCPRHVIHSRAAASLPKRGAKGVDENPSVSLSLPKLPRQGEPR